MDVDKYREMCRNILCDRDCYETLSENPTKIYKSELKTLLDEAMGEKVISKQEYGFLLPAHPVIATFYGLPKVHKGYSPLKERPIVSGVNNLTQNAGIYIDRVLRVFATSLPSYTRDTSDLLRKIEGISVDKDLMLGSIDVESLYSSILHTEGKRAVEYFLDTRGIQFNPHNTFVIRLLTFVLEKNYFVFDQKIVHQLRGTAMGP